MLRPLVRFVETGTNCASAFRYVVVVSIAGKYELFHGFPSFVSRFTVDRRKLSSFGCEVYVKKEDCPCR